MRPNVSVTDFNTVNPDRKLYIDFLSSVTRMPVFGHLQL